MDFKNFSVSPESPSLDAFSITIGAGPLTNPARALYVGTAGTITVTTFRGNSVTFTVGDGTIIPLVVTHVTAGTATNIVGFR